MTDIEYLVRRIFELERRVQGLESMLVGLAASPAAPRVAAPGPGAAPARRATDRSPAGESCAAAAPPPVQRREPVRIEARAAIEQYQHLVKNLALGWGYPECEQYLAKLVIDERGNRRGFSMQVMDELLFLCDLLRWRNAKVRLQPARVRVENPRDPWIEHTSPKQSRRSIV
jgi:hypothetical protein